MSAVVAQRYREVPVDELKPHPDNPNRGDVAAIGESIDATGFWGAVLVQASSMTILAGEHRWRAARTGDRLAKVPCLLIDVDDDQARRILLADNAYAALGVMDEEQLAGLLGELAMTPDALAGTAFSIDELDALRGVPVPDDEPQPSDAAYADTPDEREHTDRGTYAERGMSIIQVVVPRDEAAVFRGLVEDGRQKLGGQDVATGAVLLAALRGWLE